jgi:hypothetical protein
LGPLYVYDNAGLCISRAALLPLEHWYVLEELFESNPVTVKVHPLQETA